MPKGWEVTSGAPVLKTRVFGYGAEPRYLVAVNDDGSFRLNLAYTGKLGDQATSGAALLGERLREAKDRIMGMVVGVPLYVIKRPR